MGQVNALALQVIEQATRGGHHDFDASLKRLDLRLDVHAAIDHDSTQGEVLRIGLYRLLDLGGQLARRRQHQCSHWMTGGRRAAVGVRCQHLQERQGEAGSLAGAGLGAAHDVAAFQCQRDGFGLDGCGFGVAGFLHGTQKFRQQVQIGKVHVPGPAGKTGAGREKLCMAAFYPVHTISRPPAHGGRPGAVT